MILPVQHPSRGLAMPVLRQHARLSIGVAGTAGGLLLLSTNVAAMLVGGASFALVPVSANVALILGGVMFLRERKRAARVHGRNSRSESPNRASVPQ